jgi:flagellar motor switch protein FliG
MNVAEWDPLQKAALVIAALGGEAEALLAKLPPAQAEQLRRQAAGIRLTDSPAEARILEEFLAACGRGAVTTSDQPSARKFRAGASPELLSATSAPPSGTTRFLGQGERLGAWTGGSLDVSARPRVEGPESFPIGMGPTSAARPASADSPEDELGQAARKQSARAQRPFDRLRGSTACTIAQLLAAERPQVIALVLSHLPADQAGEVLACFPPSQQVEIVHRLIDLEETDPEILCEIEKALEVRLAQIVQAGRRRRAGLSAVKNIVTAADPPIRGRILGSLHQFDADLAQQLAPPQPEFEDLMLLDDAALRTVVQAAPPLVLQLALVGASESFVRRVASFLPPKEQALLKDRLEELGPTALRDIDEARNRLCRLAWHLASSGQIALPSFVSAT